MLPLSGNFDGRSIEVDGQPRPGGQKLDANLYVVTPGYLKALRIGVTRGRAVAESDTETAQYVALVSETLARLEGYLPDNTHHYNYQRRRNGKRLPNGCLTAPSKT